MISNEGLGSVKTVEKKNGLRKFSGFTQILEIKADASNKFLCHLIELLVNLTPFTSSCNKSLCLVIVLSVC